MKKILMTLAAAFVAVSMSAQVYVGGSLGLASFDDGNDSKTAFKFAPEIGYNLDEDMSVGIVFSYANGSMENAMDVTTFNKDFKEYEISPYLRYNFAKMGAVTVFADGALSYTHQDTGLTKYNGFGLGIKPGVAVTLTDKLSFVSHVGFLGYKSNKEDADGAKNHSTIGLNLDNALSFGLYYNF